MDRRAGIGSCWDIDCNAVELGTKAEAEAYAEDEDD